MLVELRDVEVHIEPQEILIQALQDYDLSIDTVISQCIYEENADEVLKAIDNADIQNYCEVNNISTTTNDFESITLTVKELNQQEKAQLVWMLLRCEG